MIITKPLSMVTCMRRAAEVACPVETPRFLESSTTNVTPAKLNEGATVFMKKVPNTNLMASRKRNVASTDRKQ